jgi:hypothetical protein
MSALPRDITKSKTVSAPNTNANWTSGANDQADNRSTAVKDQVHNHHPMAVTATVATPDTRRPAIGLTTPSQAKDSP